MPTPPRHRSSSFAFTHRAAVLGGAFALCVTTLGVALTTGDDDAAAPTGRILPAPSNLRAFSPPEDRPAVDPASIDLPGFFEAAGEEVIEWYQHVQTLANPFFEGRAPGSRGKELSSEYIEFWLKQIGLEPAFPDTTGGDEWTSHRQWLELPGGGTETLAASVTIGGVELAINDDFRIMGSSGNGLVEAPVTFVGYAIDEGPDGYTSFDDDVDLSGRIALMFRYEPMDADGASLWSDRRFSQHSAMATKLRSVIDRGAVGVLLVNPPETRHGRRGIDRPEQTRFGASFEQPMAMLGASAAARLLGHAGEADLMAWRRRADLGEVRSVQLPDDLLVSIESEVRTRTISAANIGGVLRGKGELADDWIIIGGHYDHVGYGMFGTQPRYRGQLHPGADDNASGTASTLILARRFVDAYAELDDDADARSILFILFTAEESGLHGSRHYVRNPTVDAKAINLMINLDMVGRLRNDELLVTGTGTAEGFMDLLTPHFLASGLTIRPDPSGRGPSDHANFYGAGIPVLFPFTGLHDVYHTPRDRAYTLNPIGAIKVVDLTEAIAMDFATRPERLRFTSTDVVATPTRDRGYASVRLGVAPSMDEDAGGIGVESVSPGTSAHDAGILPGDVLLAWNGEDLTSMASLVEHLRKHEPGDVVKMTLLRDGETMILDVTLKSSEG